ncbi:LmbU family transcriptional regulator [Streptacidiphilus pinicola]|uniref:LmbU family transcriptional regulator n=1 Tax=Streptacidiphilus pinicola TaxID=2219663 RepID=UPI001FB42FF1|nr:LmbU family transcriptional regulator [Streptacidiphilus pinicola]
MIPDLFTFESWERAGRQLAGVLDSSSWWLGDWLAYGKDHYSDRYQKGIQAVGLQYQTLRNYAWVARRFDMDRRHALLTFQHHAEVASLPPEEADLWLTRAEEQTWTTKQLRCALRDARNRDQVGSAQPVPVHRLPVPGDRLERWHQAAASTGVDMEEWVLATLDSAAESVLAAAEEVASLTGSDQVGADPESSAAEEEYPGAEV